MILYALLKTGPVSAEKSTNKPLNLSCAFSWKYIVKLNIIYADIIHINFSWSK